jgi:hypothetical protein
MLKTPLPAVMFAALVSFGIVAVVFHRAHARPAIVWEGLLSVAIGLALAYGTLRLIFAVFKDGDA